MLTEISTAITILMNAPKATQVVLATGKALLNLLGTAPEPSVDGAMAILMASQNKLLLDKIRAFAKYDADKQYSEIDKAQYREQIRAQTLSLLRTLKPISTSIPDYSGLLAFFEYAPPM